MTAKMIIAEANAIMSSNQSFVDMFVGLQDTFMFNALSNIRIQLDESFEVDVESGHDDIEYGYITEDIIDGKPVVTLHTSALTIEMVKQVGGSIGQALLLAKKYKNCSIKTLIDRSTELEFELFQLMDRDYKANRETWVNYAGIVSNSLPTFDADINGICSVSDELLEELDVGGFIRLVTLIGIDYFDPDSKYQQALLKLKGNLHINRAILDSFEGFLNVE